MSKIAIFSDIHANITALEAVISDADAQGVSSFACLGDIVGYGPSPGDCVTRVQELKCVSVKGNHDEYVLDDYDLSTFNSQAREALEWTRGNLSKGQKEWLGSLPYTKRLGRNLIVHATLENPEEWDYVRNSFDATLAIQAQNTPICFYGHTHVPVAYEMVENRAQLVKSSNVKVENGAKYLINVGSVGQPRDGDQKSSYVIFDRAERSIEFRRVAYDIQTVADEIFNVGLPKSLAERLVEAS